MIVTTGKHIHIRILSGHTFERSCEGPGVVHLKHASGQVDLPANEQEMEAFIEAYRAACLEKIEYARSENR